MHNMYMGEFVDRKKVEESAHKKANDRYQPADVMVHFHKHSEPCDLSHVSKDPNAHAFYSTKKEEDASSAESGGA